MFKGKNLIKVLVIGLFGFVGLHAKVQPQLNDKDKQVIAQWVTLRKRPGLNKAAQENKLSEYFAGNKVRKNYNRYKRQPITMKYRTVNIDFYEILQNDDKRKEAIEYVAQLVKIPTATPKVEKPGVPPRKVVKQPGKKPKIMGKGPEIEVERGEVMVVPAFADREQAKKWLIDQLRILSGAIKSQRKDQRAFARNFANARRSLQRKPYNRNTLEEVRVLVVQGEPAGEIQQSHKNRVAAVKMVLSDQIKESSALSRKAAQQAQPKKRQAKRTLIRCKGGVCRRVRR